jgi:hypothetical protein
MILNNIETALPIGCNQLYSYLNSSVLVNREMVSPMMASICIIKKIFVNVKGSVSNSNFLETWRPTSHRPQKL